MARHIDADALWEKTKKLEDEAIEETIVKIMFLHDNACNYYFGVETEDALGMAIEALKQIKAIEGIINVSNTPQAESEDKE